MKIEYDKEVDAAFLWLGDTGPKAKVATTEVWPKELKEHIGILMSKEGKIVGFEILFASRYIDESLLISSEQALSTAEP